MAWASTIRPLSELAQDQWGLLTRRQARQAGIAQSTFDRLASEGTILQRVAHGVYHLAGSPLPDHLELRAAWLQLAPGTPAWERTPDQGVVSHRSAAALYGLGHLPADTHEFTLPERRQTRRSDVRIHQLALREEECTQQRGLPVTRPCRIASDLLADDEDPEAVAIVVDDAIGGGYDHPAALAASLAPHAARFSLRRADGPALLEWLLDLVGDPMTDTWLAQARHSSDQAGSNLRPPGGVSP